MCKKVFLIKNQYFYYMVLFLTGMPGAGKSYWLPYFAQALNLKGIDLDDFVESELGTKIAAMIDHNLADFREKERTTLLKILKKYKDVVIATGGGTPCFEDNLAKMKNAGIIIYIQCTIEVLQKRLSHSQTPRPLLKAFSEKYLHQELEEIFQQRKTFYHQADFVFTPEKENFENAVQKIQLLLQEHGKRNI